MALIGLLVLALSILFLLSRNQKFYMDYLPAWLRPSSTRREEDEQVAQQQQTSKSPPPPAISVSEDAEEVDGDSTPKAAPREMEADSVPAISLGDGAGDDEENSPSSMSTFGSTASADAAAAAKAMPPPPRPLAAVNGSTKQNTSSSRSSPSTLMPPPPPRPSKPLAGSLQPPPSASSNLRIPTTGPLPNRGLPANSAQRVSQPKSSAANSLSPNSAPGVKPGSKSRASKKILLSPGHSPMDWAALISNPIANAAKLTGVSPPGRLLRVAPSQLKTQTGRKGKPAWTAWLGKVYNLSAYLPFHPGGEAELLRAAGTDGWGLFMEVHPWVNFEGMLAGCLVGVLVEEGKGEGQGAGGEGEVDEGMEGID